MLLEVIAGLLFILSAGVLFNDRYRSNPLLVAAAGIIALVSTYYLTVQITDQIWSSRAEDLEWRKLGPAPEAEDLEQFLILFPDGAHNREARERLVKMRRAPSQPRSASTDVETPSVGWRPGQTFRDCPDCPEMVAIPAGRFAMGSLASQVGRTANANETPQHEVVISRNFAVGKFEVTFAEWDACVAARGCNAYRPDDEGWGRMRRPVINVSWRDAQDYVSWLSGRVGKRYRLLTEAEWEYAARAGTTTQFSFGDALSPAQANYTREGTVLVDDAAFRPNVFGLFHMHGNVDEWVADCWNDGYVDAPVDGSAWTTGRCDLRPIRGGSFASRYQKLLRSAFRMATNDTLRTSFIGFRVARTE